MAEASMSIAAERRSGIDVHVAISVIQNQQSGNVSAALIPLPGRLCDLKVMVSKRRDFTFRIINRRPGFRRASAAVNHLIGQVVPGQAFEKSLRFAAVERRICNLRSVQTGKIIISIVSIAVVCLKELQHGGRHDTVFRDAGQLIDIDQANHMPGRCVAVLIVAAADKVGAVSRMDVRAR